MIWGQILVKSSTSLDYESRHMMMMMVMMLTMSQVDDGDDDATTCQLTREGYRQQLSLEQRCIQLPVGPFEDA